MKDIMATMEVKGINWVGNMYQKFENMCLDAEDLMYEDTVEYIENQVQNVGESVKKLYSDIMKDLIPTLSCILDESDDDSELPIDQQTDARFGKKQVQNFMERYAKANTKQTAERRRIGLNIDKDGIHAAAYDGTGKTGALFTSSPRKPVKKSNIVSRSRQHIGSMDVKPNQGIDVNRVNEKMVATKIFNEIASAETNTCVPSQCCEISNEDQNHIASVSKPASDEEKQISTSSSDDQSPKTMQEDLEETCVMVTSDDLELVPKEIANLKANKKTTRKGFSLSKKSARKQEYKELAVWHGKSGDLMKKLDETCNVSEPEWELL
ncbi:uncharacterized protein LOC131629451 [Vicia villosa]|uniref:uncharacterized protein LOC131629451 n=1 Tax=Vicia villosa TaxID=3911 RepID=UPI00273CBE89|nr:uncharacterized protein LOC131629451 [Vicia villosa]